MKNLQSYEYLLAIFFFTSVSATAGQVTSTFNTGDVLSATQMTEVKNAVNDNDARIGGLETTGADITGVTAGTGLTGGGVSGDVTLNVDSVTVQTRVSGACPADQSIREINENGTVTCEVDSDTDTTYTAGSGISIVDTTISANIGANITNASSSFITITQGNSSPVVVSSVTIQPPSAGYVLVTHSGSVLMHSEPNILTIGVGESTSSILTNSLIIGTLDGDYVFQRRYHAYAAQFLFAVPGAGTYIYYGLAQKSDLSADASHVDVYPQSMSAIFIPNQF